VGVENVKFGESTTNENHPHLDLNIFSLDFNHAQKEIISVRKNVVFGVIDFNLCEIAFFRLLSETHAINKHTFQITAPRHRKQQPTYQHLLW
jgi:hypothetical protein